MKQVTVNAANWFQAGRPQFRKTQRIIWVCSIVWMSLSQITFGQGVVTTNPAKVVPFNYDDWSPTSEPKVASTNSAGTKASPTFGSLDDVTNLELALPGPIVKETFGDNLPDDSIRIWVIAPTFCLILFCLALTVVMFRKHNRRAAKSCLLAAGACAVLGTVLVLYLEAVRFR